MSVCGWRANGVREVVMYSKGRYIKSWCDSFCHEGRVWINEGGLGSDQGSFEDYLP